MYHNNIVRSLKIQICPSQMLRLPGDVSPEILHFASLRITLTVPEVVGTEKWVTFNLLFLFDLSCIAKMQS